MGSKPRSQDYQASESEKASASVGMAERNFFKQKYDPLLENMRDQSFSDDNRQNLRGRANADTMQALTGETSFAKTQRTGNAGLASNALLGQLGIAEKSAGDIKNTMQTGVLGTARGQAADAQTGMAQASRLATSDALNKAKNNNAVRDAKMTAVGKVARAATQAYGANSNSKLGGFFNDANAAYEEARDMGY